jgi:hypothetical protein
MVGYNLVEHFGARGLEIKNEKVGRYSQNIWGDLDNMIVVRAPKRGPKTK